MIVGASTALKYLPPLGFGVLILLAGCVYFACSRKLAERMARGVAESPSWLRLWLPTEAYSTDKFLLRCRLTAGALMLMGCFTIIVVTMDFIFRQ
jgi:hypothetical protein